MVGMRFVVVADPLPSLNASSDTTVGLIRAAHARGHHVWTTTARALTAAHGRARARCERVEPTPADGAAGSSWYITTESRQLWLDEADVVLMRTDPPVDASYLTATLVLDLVDTRRTAIVNDPRGLRAFHEKLAMLAFSELVPPTLVTADESAIYRFARQHGKAVLKPIDGYQGHGVVLLDPVDPNLRSLAELTTDRGRRPVIVQPYLPEVSDGNKRVFVLDGEPKAAVWRYPADGDFRIGNPTALAPITDRDRHICRQLRPMLRRHGLRVAGLDVIGEHLIEVNVTSPGALGKADALLGTNLCAQIIDALTTPTRPQERPCPQPSSASASSAHW